MSLLVKMDKLKQQGNALIIEGVSSSGGGSMVINNFSGSPMAVNAASFSVAGSGDISGFCIVHTGSCTVAGSGDIKVRKAMGANITRIRIC